MRTKTLVMCTAVHAALAGMGNVYAAAESNTTASSSGMEEVIITARKTEESAQVVPVSVVALSSEGLTKAAVLSVQDLRSSVPGLYVASNSQGGAPTFSIRAAKEDNGTQKTVTAYIGDMPVATTYSIANMVYDMQSISVLKGPQGTLFGANSTGGAVIFRPNTPSNKFEGYADVGIGNYDRSTFQGMINIPVNDILQVRLAGEVVDQHKGFFKNRIASYGNSEIANDKHESARLTVKLKPSSDWEHNLLLSYFNEDDQPYGDVIGALRSRYNYTTFLGGLQIPVDYRLAGNNYVLDRQNVLYNAPTFRKNKITEMVYTLDHEISTNASFKTVIGYEDAQLNYAINNDSSRFDAVDGHSQQWIKQWTIEPSVDWKTDDGRLRNKTGLFISEKKWRYGNAYTVIGLPWDFSGFGGPGSFVAGLVNQFYPLETHSMYNTIDKSHAIYTQFSYDLSKELTATLGLRYTWDRGTYTGAERLTFGVANQKLSGLFFAGNCGTGNTTYPSYDPATCTGGAALKTQAPSFTFTLEDKFNDRSMAYATIRSGYLRGGFNNNSQPAVTGVDYTYKPEKVVDFETGLKSDWNLWGRPIRTNLAVFYASYKDQQRIQNGTTASGTTFNGATNAGASTIYGLDLDVVLEFNDYLEGALGWNHLESEYTKFNAIVNIPGKYAYADLAGQQMSQAPKDVVNFSLTAKWPLPSEVGKVSSTLGYYWTDKSQARDSPTLNCNTDSSGKCISVVAGEDFTVYDKLAAYDIWNFTTSWKGIMGSNFDANFWVKNLMDKRYFTFKNNQMLQFGYASFTYGPPRTLGLNVRYNF